MSFYKKTWGLGEAPSLQACTRSKQAVIQCTYVTIIMIINFDFWLARLDIHYHNLPIQSTWPFHMMRSVAFLPAVPLPLHVPNATHNKIMESWIAGYLALSLWNLHVCILHKWFFSSQILSMSTAQLGRETPHPLIMWVMYFNIFLPFQISC